MKNIALALSGGGFRAAAFSIGTLSYLNKIKFDNKTLLENVKFIGSTSGGSLTNVTYSLGIYNGKEFIEIYRQLLNAMDGETLISTVFNILKNKEKWKNRGPKSRNLINAFSIAYDDLLDHSEFNNLFEPKSGFLPHVQEVCINATEFTNGLSFRFQSQKEGAKNGRIGNNYIYFSNTKIGGRLLLADIMACSSCFSGGFEPFIFPDDFVHDDLDQKSLSENICLNANPFTIDTPIKELLADDDFNKIKNRFGLMDGGVADNQAIDSIFRANARRKQKEGAFDLIILTDVTSYFIDGYDLPLEKKRWYNVFSIQQVINVLKLLGVFFLGLIGWVITKGWLDWIRFIFISLGAASTLYVCGAWMLYKQRKGAIKQKSTWSIILFKYVRFFLTIRYSRIKQMVSSRLKSLFLLANDLYLKQIRRLYYEKIYSDPELREITVSNAIYDLSVVKQLAKNDQALIKEVNYETLNEPDMVDIPSPSATLITIAEHARLMPTTLWFDEFQKEEDTLKKIVATGQFTICYNLLKYLTKKEKIKSLTPDMKALKADLLEDWKQFNAQPYWLYDQLNSVGL